MTTQNVNSERTKRRYFAYLKEAKRHSEPTVDAVAKASASTHWVVGLQYCDDFNDR